MAKLDNEDLLAAWQVVWGRLDPVWHPKFLSDPLVEQIIWYDSEFIYPSLKKFRKLSDVLKHIEKSTIIENTNVTEEVRVDYLKYLAEKESRLVNRKSSQIVKSQRPDPSEIPPIEAVEITMEDLRNQPGEKHWW